MTSHAVLLTVVFATACATGPCYGPTTRSTRILPDQGDLGPGGRWMASGALEGSAWRGTFRLEATPARSVLAELHFVVAVGFDSARTWDGETTGGPRTASFDLTCDELEPRVAVGRFHVDIVDPDLSGTTTYALYFGEQEATFLSAGAKARSGVPPYPVPFVPELEPSP
jgi:hypothetical protein